jgi:hypothetical protein
MCKVFSRTSVYLDGEGGGEATKIPDKIRPGFFLHGEEPRSRCYGLTTALRLFMQPYDEDEDEQFFTKFYK